MKMIASATSAFVIIAAVASSAFSITARAAPANSAAASAASTAATPMNPAAKDELEQLLADKGLLYRLGHVRHTITSGASELVVSAMGFLGVPYRRGGNSAETGFDCSGFVRAIYEQSLGLLLPRKADQQAASTQQIERTDLQPGDLVFFNTMRRSFSHVGIYVGNGKFIHSPKPGAQVRVESMGENYWHTRFDGARRVTTESAAVARPVTSTMLTPVSIAPAQASSPFDALNLR